MRWKTSLFRWLPIGLLALLASCDFDKEVTLDLPASAPQLFLECYLKDSTAPRLALTLTQGYFDSIGITAVVNASVYLRAPDGREILLGPGLYLDTANQKLYNWGSDEIIRLHPGETWQIYARDQEGRQATASTTVQPMVPIDSITYRVRDNDTTAYIATWFRDPAGVTNFYRVIVNTDSLTGEATAEGAVEDNYRDGEQVPVRTGYTLAEYDTVYVRFYSIEQNYYRFLQSVNAAKRNNGNPFGQPSQLWTNVTGGLGIFTALTYDQRRFIIEQKAGKVE